MRRTHAALAWGTAVAGIACIAVAALLLRHRLVFHWRLGQVLEWEGGSYLARRLAGEPSADLDELERWFLERWETARPLLEAEAPRGGPERRMVVLTLLGRILQDRGLPLDPEVFWKVFEDGEATRRLLEGPLDVVATASSSDLHHAEDGGILWVRSRPGRATAWRIQRGPEGGVERVSEWDLEGIDADGLRRDLARALGMPALAGLPVRFAGFRDTKLYHLRPGRRPSEPDARLHFSGWPWMAALASRYFDIVQHPAPYPPQAPAIQDSLGALEALARNGPAEIEGVVADVLRNARRWGR